MATSRVSKNSLFITPFLLLTGILVFSCSGARTQEKSYEDYGRESDLPLLEPVPKAFENTPGISLHFESWDEKYGRPMVKCRLVNRSSKPVYFTGYGIQSPWYCIQKFENAAWVEYRVGWFCGTGLRTPELPPGKSTVFWADFPENVSAIKVGLTVSPKKKRPEEGKDTTLWTNAIQK